MENSQNRFPGEIFGTLGPACSETETIVSMIENGMNGVRLNLSHGSLKEQQEWIENMREAQKRAGASLNFLMDLKGRELRTGESEPILLNEGSIIGFGGDIPAEKILVSMIEQGDEIMIDDGKICLRALFYDSDHSAWMCEVLQGGLLPAHKSVKILDKYALFSPLCNEDYANLASAEKYGVNSLMVPFVQSRQDLIQVHQALEKYGLNLKVYAKIENRIGIRNLESFLDLADVIVIARGDLGNDLGFAGLPAGQTDIEKICRRHDKPYMVVTEMLTHMLDHPFCTRAEANDVFSAIRNGASSVMVTNETAVGRYPAEVIRTLSTLAKAGYDYRLSELAG